MDNSRAVVWFSCGAASAVAAKMAVKKYGNRCVIAYCDTSKDEHPDNMVFLADIEKWLEKDVIRLRNNDFEDRWDVYKKTGWLIGKKGARCTTELKKKVRFAFQKPDDIHILGYTLEEGTKRGSDRKTRIQRFECANPELKTDWILFDAKITKQMCYAIINKAGIALPAMYRQGYNHSNCVGCVKGQAGYWNKIRIDYPDVFKRMAKEERRLNAAICKKQLPNGKWVRVFLDELNPKQGNYKHEVDVSCDSFCQIISNDMA